MSGNNIVQLRPGGPGRGPARVVAVHEDLVEPWAELHAIASEACAFAAAVVELMRRSQVAIAAGEVGLVAHYADRLERAAAQQEGRAKSAQVLARLRQAELDGIACADAIAAPGHGEAA